MNLNGTNFFETTIQNYILTSVCFIYFITTFKITNRPNPIQ
eukprot:UN04471